MAMTHAQIIAIALQIAKAPNFIAQAENIYNGILSDLCQTYDLDVTRGSYRFNFNIALGSGPIPLPADYLRAETDDAVSFVISGLPFFLIPIDLDEFDHLLQTPGFQDLPDRYATDMSQTPPVMYVYPPPSAGYPVLVRYRRQMPDVTTPSTNTGTPWFPNSVYLYTKLAGEIMKITDDERANLFLDGSDMGAEGILRKYLQLQGDQESRSQRVRLDRRRFGSSGDNLPPTKQTGF